MNDIYANALSLLDNENRQNILDNPKEYAQSLGMDVDEKEVVVVLCDKNTIYIPLPEINADMSPVELGKIHAAGTASTVISAGSLLALATAPAA